MFAHWLTIVAVLLTTAAPAVASDSYVIIVENTTVHVRNSLEGFPGRCWGKTVNKTYLYGGQTQLGWLDEREIKYKAAIFDEEPSDLYACYVNTAGYSLDDPNIVDIDSDYVISMLPVFNAQSYRRLSLRKLPFNAGEDPITEVMEYHPFIDELIGSVSRDTLVDFLTRFSGEAPVEVGGDMDTIHTRFTGTEENELAARYLKETLEDYNYEVEYHSFFGGRLRQIAVYDQNIAWVVGEDSEALRTTDGGGTWHNLIINEFLSLWGVTNVGADSVWLTGVHGTIRFSSDAGDSFTSQSTGTYYCLFSPCFINSTEGWVAGDFGTIIHTTNAGQNWSSQTTPTDARLYDIDFVDDEYGWAVGRHGSIIHTANGGANWIHQTSNTTERIYSVDFIDRDNGWLVGGAGVVSHTTNGGADWQAVDIGDNSEKYHVDFADDLHGCIVGWNGEIFITTDGGLSWTQSGSGTTKDFYGVEFADNATGYAVGTGVIRKTTDGGTTWIDQTDGIEEVWNNVVSTKTGSVNPDQQVIICAHMDDTSQMPETDAPGADDNGSGSAAVMEAARLFSAARFEKTIKFCLWTGEEQGLLGSEAYAGEAFENGDDIVGVFNFDMISWDANNDYHGELHCGTMDASIALGDLFEEVIADYDINLSTSLFTQGSTDRSDHASFWDYNYPAILGIEDLSYDYNPFIHTTWDNMAFVDADFLTEYTKAAVGAAASLAIPDTTQVGIEYNEPLPSGLVLGHNYPNPFNALTTIQYALPEASTVTIEIYDILGRKIETLVQREQQVGYHQVVWDAKDVSSGMYFYRIQAGDYAETRKMVLLK
jgi:photosystem II stability/assembly factor-like uncharacterized protein